jgi:hypothetical protein
MSVKQFAAQFRATIENIKAKGTAAIFCGNIINYLRSVENSPEPESRSGKFRFTMKELSVGGAWLCHAHSAESASACCKTFCTAASCKSGG